VVSSGLGEARPLNIVVLPVLFEEEVKAVIELASFNRFSETHVAFLDQLTESIGIVINTIEANTRTERLLTQSQQLAGELQSRQDELKKTNERLEQYEYETMIYFAKDHSFNRNILGRQGRLDRIRMGLVDYEGKLYLRDYNGPIS
jgi:transcriptional regulator with GAF, ATPase, and Fis domain